METPLHPRVGPAASASSAYLCRWGWMPAPQLHPDVPHGWSGQKAGGMPEAWRESWRGCQAPGGGGGDHSCYSGGELGHGAHQGYQGSARKRVGDDSQACRASGNLRVLPCSHPLFITHSDNGTPFPQVTDFPTPPPQSQGKPLLVLP